MGLVTVQETEFVDGEGNICTLKGDEHGLTTARRACSASIRIGRCSVRPCSCRTAIRRMILDKMNDFARSADATNSRSISRRQARPLSVVDTCGQLIEQAGLKGHERRRGTGFWKNTRISHQPYGATCDDMRLIELVHCRVRGAVRRGAGVRGAHHRKISAQRRSAAISSRTTGQGER